MRKFIGIVVLVCFLFLNYGCKKKITQFSMDYNSELVIGSSFEQLIPFSVSTPESETNSSYEFDAHDTDADRVKSIFLKSMVLSITSPVNKKFTFLKSVIIYIDSPNQPEVKLASKENIDNSVGNQITMDLVDLDLKEYLKDKTFVLRLQVTTDETLPEDVHINVYTDFLVDAKVIRFKK